VLVAGKLIVTALPPPGLNAYPVEATIVPKLEPFGLPWTARVWVRASQPAGSLSTIWSMFRLLPRSTWADCGRALLALSQ
jgi:hypothetical protein